MIYPAGTHLIMRSVVLQDSIYEKDTPQPCYSCGDGYTGHPILKIKDLSDGEVVAFPANLLGVSLVVVKPDHQLIVPAGTKVVASEVVEVITLGERGTVLV